MIFIQNKNHNDQIVFLQNLHLGLCKNGHFQKKRVRFEEQIRQNWILKIHILILIEEEYSLYVFFYRILKYCRSSEKSV